MPTVNLEFGAAVTEKLEEHGLKNRQQVVRTGIDHVTISRMKQGIVPSLEIVERFAIGFGESVNKWRVLAGYGPVAPTMNEATEVILEAAEGHFEELTYEPEWEDIEIRGLHGRVSPASIERLQRLTRKLAAEEAARQGRKLVGE